MVSKNKTKLIKSLHQKKYRKKTGMFLVEGAKSVLELLQSHIKVTTLVGTEVFLKEHGNMLHRKHAEADILIASEQEISALGVFKSNNAALAVAEIPESGAFGIQPAEYVLALDDISDPGNLGTIIRIADWYGIQKIVCSVGTTDCFSPKVVSASMGSFLRVQLWYVDLEHFLKNIQVPVYGAFLEGDDVHQTNFQPGGVLVLGNESEGIGKHLERYIGHRISIPKYGAAESLNVAIATAVICDNVMRSRQGTSS